MADRGRLGGARRLAAWSVASARLRRPVRCRIERVKLYRRDAIAIDRDCRLEHGAILDARGGGGIVLGEGATVRAGAILESQSHGIRIGAHVLVNSNTHVFGPTEVGPLAMIGPGCTINAHQHEFAAPGAIRPQEVIAEPVRIGAGPGSGPGWWR